MSFSTARYGVKKRNKKRYLSVSLLIGDLLQKRVSFLYVLLLVNNPIPESEPEIEKKSVGNTEQSSRGVLETI